MPGKVEIQVTFGLVQFLADPIADAPTHRWTASPRAEVAGVRSRGQLAAKSREHQPALDPVKSGHIPIHQEERSTKSLPQNVPWGKSSACMMTGRLGHGEALRQQAATSGEARRVQMTWLAPLSPPLRE